MGVQTSLVSAEEEVRFSTQASNQQADKTTVYRSVDNSTVIVLISDSDDGPSKTKQNDKKTFI